MTRTLPRAGWPARLMTLARETFEVSVAVLYAAPWEQVATDDATTHARHG